MPMETLAMPTVKAHLRTAVWSAFACLSLAGFAAADDPPATDAQPPVQSKKALDKRTLDDELLEGLGVADPLADLEADSKLETPAEKSATETGEQSLDGPPADKPKKRPASGIDEELLRGLGDGEDIAFGPADNPLIRLNQRMRDVQRRIAEAESGGETQRLEQDIARELADLVRQSEQACRACQKSGGPPSSSKKKSTKQSGREAADPSETPGEPNDQPARESSDRLRKDKTAPVDRAERQQLLKDVWGHLPAHLRQQMEQSANEEFLPKYSLEIADYYRALVERRRRK